ncbi:hypothetical protein D9M72_521010 [compost metagenome]
MATCSLVTLQGKKPAAEPRCLKILGIQSGPGLFQPRNGFRPRIGRPQHGLRAVAFAGGELGRQHGSLADGSKVGGLFHHALKAQACSHGIPTVQLGAGQFHLGGKLQGRIPYGADHPFHVFRNEEAVCQLGGLKDVGVGDRCAGLQRPGNVP